MNPMKCFSLALIMICSSVAHAQIDTVAYSLGVNLGQRLVKQGAQNIDYQGLIQGIKAAMEGQELLLDQSAIDRISFDYYQSQKKKYQK